MADSDLLALREMTATMNNRHAVLNEWLAILESAAGHVPAIEVGTNTPPGSPANGNVYITGSSPTGDWAGEANSVARYYNDAWTFVPVREGMTAYDTTLDVPLVYLGAAWAGLHDRRQASVTLANGTNTGISVPRRFMRITGPTGAFTINGMIPRHGDGDEVILFNTTSQAMTIADQSGTEPTGGRRIRTVTGADVVLAARLSFATFVYDAFSSRWLLVSTN